MSLERFLGGILAVACSAGILVAALAPLPAHADGSTQPRHVHGLAPLPGGAPVPEHLRPPGSLPDDGGPSPVIFPAQKITLRFNHRKHVRELGMTCTTCHDGAKTSRKSADRLLPAATRCDACHGSDHRNLQAVGAGDDLIGQCGFCHIGWRPEDAGQVERMVLPEPNLRFDHAAHFGRNIGCEQCHGRVGELELATRDQLPRMRGCFRCHQAPEPARGRARGECTTCHLTRRAGTLETSFETGQLLPPRWLQDAGHGPDWIERHKRVAGVDSQFCSNCHTERYCTDCHDGRVRPRRVHPNDWLSMHPVAARQNNPTCTSCHRLQSFCVGCHQRAGVTLSGAYARFAGRGSFHPPKAVWTDGPRGPSHHAWEAQRNLDACVSCHVERDCAICHATAAVGGRGTGVGGTAGGRGVNPHPAGFLGRCRSALKKNARPCLVCHDPADPKLGECR
jgi:hypothetical protein